MIGEIDPDGPGGESPLLVKGDFIFVGVVPEPTTALLLGGAASWRWRVSRAGGAEALETSEQVHAAAGSGRNAAGGGKMRMHRRAIGAVALGIGAAPARRNDAHGHRRGASTASTPAPAPLGLQPAIWSLGSGELYAATGTITIDTFTNTMTISLAVASSVLDARGSQPVTDDTATSVDFTGGTYTARSP